MGVFRELFGQLQRGQNDRAEQYDHVMFPFGREQQRQEEALLKELVGNGLTLQEKIFLLVTAREAQLARDPKDHLILLRDWMNSPLLRHIRPEEAALIFGQAELGRQIESMEEIPAAAQVREQASAIYQHALRELEEAEQNGN